MIESGKSRPRRPLTRLSGLVVVMSLALCALAPSAFGAAIKSFEANFETRFGNFATEGVGVPTQAGSHPYLAGALIRFTTRTENEEVAPGEVTERLVNQSDPKDIDVELPAGLIGDPSATPRCEPALVAEDACPANTQIGLGGASLVRNGLDYFPMYNLTPPPGVPAEFGFKVFGVVPIFVTATVRPAKPGSDEGYGLDLHIHNVSQSYALQAAGLKFFGIPPGVPSPSSKSIEGLKPFVTMPTSCGRNLEIRAHVSFWDGAPAETVSTLVPGQEGKPLTITGCDQVPFEPQVSTGLDLGSTDSPSGLTVDIKTPQQTSFQGIASANLRSTTVTLPDGVSINPSAAGGRGACSVAQFDQFSEAASTCPDDARVGSLEIDTPLIPDPLLGSVYLARQSENPFGSLVALYLVAEGDGVRVKLPGNVAENALTGQLTASFDDTPQLPFEELKLHLDNGPRAPLATPVVCGSAGVPVSLTPWSRATPTVLAGSLAVSSGAGGTACPPSPGARPFGIGLEAGTASSAAATHSPFVLRVNRPDGAQELSRIDATLPEGLLASLKGVPECAAANAAAGSCGAASQVGSLVVGAGAGPSPYHVEDGRAYLTGPYGGAPLGLDFVVPAVAGPFDLGTVNVRAALFVDQETTKVTVKSDPLPRILQGIPLRLRSVAVDVDRPGFIVNPTSCDPTSVTSRVTSTEGAIANPSDRFQATGCRGLAFTPKVTPKLLGGRKTLRRGGHPKLRVTLAQPDGQANLSSVALTLPRSILLDQNHIKTVCTRVQFAAEACPAASVYGHASVTTPLLDKPLEGPVYLRSSSHTLPDLVFDLRGQIRLVLAGRIDSRKGGIRVSFDEIPDAAVGSFVLDLRGGAKGLLQPSADLCQAKARTTVRTVGQNATTADTRPVLATSCQKPKRPKKAGR